MLINFFILTSHLRDSKFFGAIFSTVIVANQEFLWPLCTLVALVIFRQLYVFVFPRSTVCSELLMYTHSLLWTCVKVLLVKENEREILSIPQNTRPRRQVRISRNYCSFGIVYLHYYKHASMCCWLQKTWRKMWASPEHTLEKISTRYVVKDKSFEVSVLPVRTPANTTKHL